MNGIIFTFGLNKYTVKDKINPYLPPGYISGTKPIFASKNYLGKNIEIIIDVLNDELQTRRLSVIFL